MRRILPIAFLLFAAGCFPYRRTTYYPAFGEPAGASGLPAVRSMVLDVCRQWIAPVPDAAKGWCFRLEVKPWSELQPGAVITVPSEDARPVLSVITPPGMTESRGARGTVRIRRMQAGRMLADVDLEDPGAAGGPWRLRRSLWFRFDTDSTIPRKTVPRP